MDYNYNDYNLLDMLMELDGYMKKQDISVKDEQDISYIKSLLMDNMIPYTINNPDNLDLNNYLDEMLSNLNGRLERLNEEKELLKLNKVKYISKLNELQKELTNLTNTEIELRPLIGVDIGEFEFAQLLSNKLELEKNYNNTFEYVRNIDPRITLLENKLSDIIKQIREYKSLGINKVAKYMIQLLNQLMDDDKNFDNVSKLIAIIKDKVKVKVVEKPVDVKQQRLMALGKNEVEPILNKLKQGNNFNEILRKNKDLLFVKSNKENSIIEYLLDNHPDVVGDLLKSNKNLESELLEFLYENVDMFRINTLIVDEMISNNTLIDKADREFASIKSDLVSDLDVDRLKLFRFLSFIDTLENNDFKFELDKVKSELFKLNNDPKFKKLVDELIYRFMEIVFFNSSIPQEKLFRYIYTYENSKEEDKIDNLINNLENIDFDVEGITPCKVLKGLLKREERKNKSLYDKLQCKYN